jgi:hypothetical protein
MPSTPFAYPQVISRRFAYSRVVKMRISADQRHFRDGFDSRQLHKRIRSSDGVFVRSIGPCGHILGTPRNKFVHLVGVRLTPLPRRRPRRLHLLQRAARRHRVPHRVGRRQSGLRGRLPRAQRFSQRAQLQRGGRRQRRARSARSRNSRRNRATAPLIGNAQGRALICIGLRVHPAAAHRGGLQHPAGAPADVRDPERLEHQGASAASPCCWPGESPIRM